MALAQHRLAGTARQEQILKIARKLFARRGFQGTTTRQIAERAGVSEAILFRHFPSKVDLYWSVLESRCGNNGSRGQLAEKLAAAGDDRQVFRAIAETILRRSEQDTAMTRLLLFAALENHRLASRFFQVHIAEKYETLAIYIRRRIRQGAFRGVDPRLAARSFVGMLAYHVLTQELFGGKLVQRFDLRNVSETLTDLWLEGIQAKGPRQGCSGRTAKRVKDSQ